VLSTSSASIAVRELSRMAGGSPVIRRQRSTKTAVGRSATAPALDVEQPGSVCAGIAMRSERTQATFGPFHPAEMVKRSFPRSSLERFAAGRAGCACAFGPRKTASCLPHATRCLRDKHRTGGGRRTPQRRRGSPARPRPLTCVIRGRQPSPQDHVTVQVVTESGRAGMQDIPVAWTIIKTAGSAIAAHGLWLGRAQGF
jgi:hypothetical protein